jgi:hypothetical protein
VNLLEKIEKIKGELRMSLKKRKEKRKKRKEIS